MALANDFPGEKGGLERERRERRTPFDNHSGGPQDNCLPLLAPFPSALDVLLSISAFLIEAVSDASGSPHPALLQRNTYQHQTITHRPHLLSSHSITLYI